MFLKKIYFFIIFKYLFKRYRFFYLPFGSSLLSVSAIAISVATLIITMSVMNGFREELLKVIMNMNSHITIYIDSKIDYKKKIDLLKNNSKIVSVNYFIIGNGLITNGKNAIGVGIKGIDFHIIKDRKDLIKNIPNFENILSAKKDFDAIIGFELMSKMNLHIGNNANIIVPRMNTTIFGLIPAYKSVKIIGFINTGVSHYDSSMIFLDILDAKKLLEKNSISGIEIMIKDPDKVELFLNYIKNIFQNEYITNWKEENFALIRALKTESNVMNIILGMFVLLSVFTIFNGMNNLVKEKEKEIAILRSLGMQKKEIWIIFFLCGFIIGIIGIVIGLIVGIFFSFNIESIRLFLEQIFNTKLLDGSVYFDTGNRIFLE